MSQEWAQEAGAFHVPSYSLSALSVKMSVRYSIFTVIFSMSDKSISLQDDKNDWVKLVSRDGFSYVVRREVAMGSGTLSNMLSSDSKPE